MEDIRVSVVYKKNTDAILQKGLSSIYKSIYCIKKSLLIYKQASKKSSKLNSANKSEIVDVCEKYKYLHIFPSELKFSSRVIKLLQDPDNELFASEHLFVVYSRSIYEELKKIDRYGSVVLYESENEPLPVYEIIDKYADSCDWIFLHSIGDVGKVHKIKHKYYKKIIWRTWGLDTELTKSSKKVYKYIIKCILDFLHNRFVMRPFASSIQAIGIANIIDEVALKRKGLKNKLFHLPYVTEESFDSFNNIEKNIIKDNCLNVCVGHSAYNNDRHFEIIDLLEKFKKENMKVYFMLSYGKEEIKKRVSEYAKQKLGEDKTVIVDKFISLDEYKELLSKMNIAILAGKTSYAIGNINIFLRKGKTLYLAEKSVLDETFNIKKIQHHCIEEIRNMDYSEFATLYENVNGNLSSVKSYKEALNNWSKCLKQLSSL